MYTKDTPSYTFSVTKKKENNTQNDIKPFEINTE